MHYELNVALNGVHFFATHPRSALNLYEAKRLYVTFKEKFPEADGWSISCAKVETKSEYIDMEKSS